MVGMEPRQKLKMMLIEHGFGVAIAVGLGAAVSFIGSHIFIQKFLITQMGNDYVYVWPVGPALLITALVFGTVMAGPPHRACNVAKEDRSISGN